MALLLLALGGVCLPSCGGGPSPAAPSSPSTPPPTPTPVPLPVARDGLTHEIVSAGISPPTPRVGDAVTVGAPLFLVREQVFDGNAIFLWPADQGRDQEYVNELVYFAKFTDDTYHTLLHEMGHVVGLGHSPDRREVMAEGEGPGTLKGEFQQGEALALHMMYAHRTAGNISPDRDAALSARSLAAVRPLTVEILD